MDERGEVIGVATGIFTEGQNLNFAVPVTKLAALLKEDSNPFLIRNPVAPTGDPDLDSGLVTTPDQEGELLYDWGDLPAGPNWKPVLPNSVGEAELSFVCKGRQ